MFDCFGEEAVLKQFPRGRPNIKVLGGGGGGEGATFLSTFKHFTSPRANVSARERIYTYTYIYIYIHIVIYIVIYLFIEHDTS